MVMHYWHFNKYCNLLLAQPFQFYFAHCALYNHRQDTWKEICTEGRNFGLGGETVFYFVKLTDYVTTVETRGIFDFSARRLSDVMAEISKYITTGILSSCMVSAFSTNNRYTDLHKEGLQSLFIHDRAHSFCKCTFYKVIFSATEINSPIL